MKKRLICIAFGIFSASVFAQTCPPVEQIFHNGTVVLPWGWELKTTPHITSNDLGFMVAGWGDHHSTCYSRFVLLFQQVTFQSFIY